MTSPSRWRAGTLAAAGTTPGRSMGAEAIPGKSQGHHPAGHRPAIPTRAYESGSDGHRRHAAPARHPYPPRPPPGQASPREPRTLAARSSRRPAPGVKGACGVAARALRAPVTPGAAREIWQRSRPWGQPGMPPHLHTGSAKSSDNRINQAQEQQEVDGPLHMRSLLPNGRGFSGPRPARSHRGVNGTLASPGHLSTGGGCEWAKYAVRPNSSVRFVTSSLIYAED